MTVKPMIEEWYEFSPLNDVSQKDFVAILKAVKLTLHKEAWQNLDEDSKKHFIVNKRTGEAYRYGNEPKTRKVLNR